MADVPAGLATALQDRYRLDRELGQGGMATVYLAQDLKHDRKVALKVLRPELAAAIGAERFLREITLTAQLNHPHILPLLDSGQAPDASGACLYYVMPYVEGESLRDRLNREKQLPLDDALRLTREVADGLGAAHSLGVVHRDIKPENILLSGGHAVIADFGIARALKAAGGSRLTETGLVVGTPAYMSPEQAAGDTELDKRSDIYSLGCVLFEMLAGETPYTGPTPQAILAKKLTEPLPRVSVIRQAVPAGVEAALARALARAPADRFSSTAQLTAALTPPFASAEPMPRSPRRWAFPLVGAFAAIVLTTLAWLGWTRGGFGAAAPIGSIAVLPPQDLSGDSTQQYLALGIHDGLIGELDQVGSLRVISRTSMMSYAGTRKPVSQIARELGVDALVETSVRRSGDSLHIRVQLLRARPVEQNLWGRRYDRNIEDILKLYGEMAQDIARGARIRTTSDQEARLASAPRVSPETYSLYVKGMYFLDKGTPEGASRGIGFLRQAIEHDPGDALAWAGLAVGYITAAHGPAPPTDALPLARAAAERALKLDSTLAETMASLAFIKGYYDWDWEASDQLFRKAIALNPNSSLAHYWYSWQLALFGRMEEAIAEHRLAQAVDPLNPLNTAWLGWLLFWQGKYDEAMDEAQRALALDPAFPVSYFVMAEVYLARGNNEKAIASARRAATADPEWKWVLGKIAALAGHEAEAREVLAQLHAQPLTPWVAWSLAVVNAALGDRDEAFRWLNYEHPHAWVPWVRFDHAFKSLWGDPRMGPLLKKMNLPPLSSSAP
jgi:serine/threonine-protein kinase